MDSSSSKDTINLKVIIIYTKFEFLLYKFQEDDGF